MNDSAETSWLSFSVSPKAIWSDTYDDETESEGDEEFDSNNINNINRGRGRQSPVIIKIDLKRRTNLECIEPVKMGLGGRASASDLCFFSGISSLATEEINENRVEAEDSDDEDSHDIMGRRDEYRDRMVEVIGTSKFDATNSTRSTAADFGHSPASPTTTDVNDLSTGSITTSTPLSTTSTRHLDAKRRYGAVFVTALRLDELSMPNLPSLPSPSPSQLSQTMTSNRSSILSFQSLSNQSHTIDHNQPIFLSSDDSTVPPIALDCSSPVHDSPTIPSRFLPIGPSYSVSGRFSKRVSSIPPPTALLPKRPDSMDEIEESMERSRLSLAQSIEVINSPSTLVEDVVEEDQEGVGEDSGIGLNEMGKIGVEDEAREREIVASIQPAVDLDGVSKEIQAPLIAPSRLTSVTDESRQSISSTPTPSLLLSFNSANHYLTASSTSTPTDTPPKFNKPPDLLPKSIHRARSYQQFAKLVNFSTTTTSVTALPLPVLPDLIIEQRSLTSGGGFIFDDLDPFQAHNSLVEEEEERRLGRESRKGSEDSAGNGYISYAQKTWETVEEESNWRGAFSNERSNKGLTFDSNRSSALETEKKDSNYGGSDYGKLRSGNYASTRGDSIARFSSIVRPRPVFRSNTESNDEPSTPTSITFSLGDTIEKSWKAAGSIPKQIERRASEVTLRTTTSNASSTLNLRGPKSAIIITKEGKLERKSSENTSFGKKMKGIFKSLTSSATYYV
jgi:hypothetical protein